MEAGRVCGCRSDSRQLPSCRQFRYRNVARTEMPSLAEAERVCEVLLGLRQSMSRAFSPSFFSISFFAASDRAFVFFRSMVTLSILPVNLLFPFA